MSQRHCLRCQVLVYPKTNKPRYGKVHDGRGLCSCCHQWAVDHSCLDDYKRLTKTREEVMSAWVALHRRGYTRSEAAAFLGMDSKSFRRAHGRARAAGDPRAKLDRIQIEAGIR